MTLPLSPAICFFPYEPQGFEPKTLYLQDMREREHWVDRLKGFCMTAILLNHTAIYYAGPNLTLYNLCVADGSDLPLRPHRHGAGRKLKHHTL